MAEAPLELSRSISRRLSGSAPEAVTHRHRAGSFFARSSPFSGSGEEEERQRLGAMLASYGLCERLVKGDGNCQARPAPACEAPSASCLRYTSAVIVVSAVLCACLASACVLHHVWLWSGLSQMLLLLYVWLAAGRLVFGCVASGDAGHAHNYERMPSGLVLDTLKET